MSDILKRINLISPINMNENRVNGIIFPACLYITTQPVVIYELVFFHNQLQRAQSCKQASALAREHRPIIES